MRLILAVATTLMLAAVPSAAHATTVRRVHSVTDPTPFPVGDVCPFPVQGTGTFDISATVVYTDDTLSTLVRVEAAVVETDVFTANGKTLTSVPYHYSGHLYFDAAGHVTASFDTGVVVRIPLPDGSMFVAAGRKDLLNDLPAVVPDVGTSGNIAAFCAALSA